MPLLQHLLIVFFYVDDITAVCSRENLPRLKTLKEELMKKFKKGRFKIGFAYPVSVAYHLMTHHPAAYLFPAPTLYRKLLEPV
jgi:hypothetical protein